MQRGFATIWIVVIAAIVVVGGGAAAYVVTDGFGTNKTDSTDDQANHAHHNHSASASDPRSLMASLASGNVTGIECTYTLKKEGVHGHGRFASTETYRTDLTDKTGHHIILFLNDKSYMWKQGDKEGIVAGVKDNLKKLEEQFGTLDAEKIKKSDDANVTYLECNDVPPFDASVFKLPKDVTFHDLSALGN